MAETSDTAGFDRHAAVTRSLLGYGVLAGVFYLVVGLILALTRDGFDVTRYPLSLLMLGEDGWMQRANLMVTGGDGPHRLVGILPGDAGRVPGDTDTGPPRSLRWDSHRQRDLSSRPDDWLPPGHRLHRGIPQRHTAHGLRCRRLRVPGRGCSFRRQVVLGQGPVRARHLLTHLCGHRRRRFRRRRRPLLRRSRRACPLGGGGGRIVVAGGHIDQRVPHRAPS